MIGAIAAKADNANDTIFSAYKADSIIVAERADGLYVTIIDKDEPSHHRTIVQSYSSERVVKTRTRRTCGYEGVWNHLFGDNDNIEKVSTPGHWDAICGGFGVGLSTAINSRTQLSVPFGKSFEVQWLYVLGARYRIPGTQSSINIGAGLSYRNFRTTTGDMLALSVGGVTLTPYPEGATPKSSQLDVWSVTAPLVWRINLPWTLYGPGKMSMMLGAIGVYNMSGSIHNTWLDAAGNKVRQNPENSYIRRFTAEFIGAIYVNSWLGLYVRYSPMAVLRTGSPQFRPLTTGLMVSF